MNKKEAKQLLMKFLMPEIEKFGFKEKKSGVEWSIGRKTEFGEDLIVGGFTDYNPSQQILFSLSKRDKRIFDILLSIEKYGISLPLPISKHLGTIGFSYETLTGLNRHGYLPDMLNEEDVKKCVDTMLTFLRETAFPLLDRFNDLHEIDSIINGDSPWQTDWHKPYAFSTYFDYTRLIIAKLVDNPKYDMLVDFTLQSIKEIGLAYGYSREVDPNDLTKPLPVLLQILKEVKPLA
jgi:hypothetical protein